MHCPAVQAHNPDMGPCFRWVWPPPASLSSSSYSCQRPNSCSLYSFAFSASLCSERQPRPEGGGTAKSPCPLSLPLQPQPSEMWQCHPDPGMSPSPLLSLLSHTTHTATNELMHLYGIILPGGNIFPSALFFFFDASPTHAWKAELLKVSEQLQKLG